MFNSSSPYAEPIIEFLQLLLLMNLDNIDFDSAAYTINQDGSYLHQQNELWGLYDFGESPNNPIVPYIFKTKKELILWYFDDMAWDLRVHSINADNLD